MHRIAPASEVWRSRDALHSLQTGLRAAGRHETAGSRRPNNNQHSPRLVTRSVGHAGIEPLGPASSGAGMESCTRVSFSLEPGVVQPANQMAGLVMSRPENVRDGRPSRASQWRRAAGGRSFESLGGVRLHRGSSVTEEHAPDSKDDVCS